MQFTLWLLAAAVFLPGLASAQTQHGEALPLHPSRHIQFEEKEATWSSLDVSPDGKTIVFELLGDIYQLPIGGGEARCIVCGLPFDSQPVYSPDGTQIAFVSDRSGNENLWIARADGSASQQLSLLDDNSIFISPAWANDGKSIYISRYKPDLNAFELWSYSSKGGAPQQVTHAKSAPDTPKEFRYNALGAAVSPDGHFLYYESKTGYGFNDDVTFPLWHIVRRNLSTGDEDTAVTAQGSAFRPLVSPDGNSLMYATRLHGKTGLRLRSLVNDQDTLLLYPIQRDDQEASASRDLLPRYAFTPDSQAILLNYDGQIHRLQISSGAIQTVPFHAHVDLPTGPYLRPEISEETGPVRARIIQTPSLSPDGQRLTFSALGHVYVMGLRDLVPHRLTFSEQPEFDPSWSPDGLSIVYVSWTARGGDIWRVSANAAAPRKLSIYADDYTFPIFTPDGKSIVALRCSNYEHNHRFMELPPTEADAILLPADGGAAAVITSGVMSNIPQFTTKPNTVYLNFSDGLYEMPLQAVARKRRVLNITGPTWYFVDGLAPADAIKISPDGRWALAQITQQLYLIQIPQDGQELAVELGKPSPLETRLTATGADFFDWADGGNTITWSVGSTFFREQLASVSTGHVEPPAASDQARANVRSLDVVVEVPRDTPRGTLLLRGATAITMRGDEVIPNADIVIVDDRIAAVGARGAFQVPAGAITRDITGKYITPGFTDTHMHWAGIRRNVLDLEDWGFLATLAYGVTSGLDPSSLSIDMFAYEDLLDAGMMTGSRVFTTGPAVFSFNNFQSAQQALHVLERNSLMYRTRNVKEYRSGNRRQREWVLEAANQLHMLATTEGALDMKLDMTQIQDGFPGNEHAYSAVPVADDIVQLFARSGVSYTPTLQISNGGLPAQEFFYAAHSPHDDTKLRHFEPGFFLDHKTERMHWALPFEYAYAEVAVGATKIQRAGGIVGVGSHGELPGFGYHLELQALASGGMTPMEVLHAATIGSSKTIGRDAEFGSLEKGKFADLIILDKNPLQAIENTLSIDQVMKNGRLYDAQTLDEIWPRQKALNRLWFQQEH